MKTTNKLILAGAIVMASSNLFSQKVKKQEATFSYTQLPSQPLEGVSNYWSEATLRYVDAINEDKEKERIAFEQKKADYPAVLAEAKQRHADKMERYDKEMKAYKEKSFGEKLGESKLLNTNSKPVKPSYFYPPSPPVEVKKNYQKIFSPDVLTGSKLKLDGFKKNEENAVKISIDLFGFESLEPELKSVESNSYDTKLKRSVTTTTYWYEVVHKHPINLKIELPNGELLLDEVFAQSDEFTIGKSRSRKNSRPVFKEEDFLKRLQNSIVNDNLQKISNFINDNYGYPAIERKTIIYKVKAKKHNYDDYDEALILAEQGYGDLVNNPTEAEKNIKGAIKIWEEALIETEPYNKKARINPKVSVATIFNLVEANIWINDFKKAKENLALLKNYDPSRGQKKQSDNYRDLIKEMEDRFKANNK